MANSDPRIIKSTALAKATQLEARVNALAASASSKSSPVVIYQPGGTVLYSAHGDVTSGGTWTCPAGVYSVQVECWAAGGGGGGGTSTAGGGGGGGGEYAAEYSYSVVPGQVYSFSIGRPGQGGVCNGSGGDPGGDTIFDPQGIGLPGGIHAHGGQGGDIIRFNGGTGSVNSTHTSGGFGGISTAGVNSDNPLNLGNLLFWWKLDQTGYPTSSAITTALDVSGNHNYGSVAGDSGGGAVVAPVQAGAPNQVSEKIIQAPGVIIPIFGNCAYFNQGSSGGVYIQNSTGVSIGGTSGSTYDGSAITVSAWVKADTTKNSWGRGSAYGTGYGTIFANCDYANAIKNGPSSSACNGFALYLAGNKPGFYLGNKAATAANLAISSASALNTNDNVWHYIVGTFDGTTMTLYVDGTSVATGTPGLTGSKFGAGGSPVTLGANPVTKSLVFTGQVSGAYVGHFTASSAYVTQAYGGSPATGGSGGAASGGSAGAGSNGANAAATSGGAGGGSAAGTDSLHGGSGAGGAGGNAGAAGTAAANVAPYGGGGGGAGSVASPSSVSSTTVTALQSASYCGIDAAGGNNGSLYDISDEPEAGETSPYPGIALVSPNMYTGGAPDTSYNGSFNSVVLLPATKQALSGQTVNTVTVNLTIQSTNASVLPVWYVGTAVNSMPPSLGSDTDIASYLGTLTALVKIPIPAGAAGRQISFDITNSGFITALNTAGLTAMVFGGLQGSGTYGLANGSYSAPDSYAWNTVFNGANNDDPTQDLNISIETFPSAGTNTTAGDGAPGYLVITQPNPNYWPVAALQPDATETDSGGNTFGEAITADSVIGFDMRTPGAYPRIPEAWHSLGTLAAGSGLSTALNQARYRYSPEDGGTLVIQVMSFVNSSATITSGTYNFSHVLESSLQPTVSATAAQDLIPFNLSALNNGTAILGLLYVNGKNSASPGTVTIKIPTTVTNTNPTFVHVVARIPLT